VFTALFRHFVLACRSIALALGHRLRATLKPPGARVVTGILSDLVRSKPALIAENALLRQQLIILQHRVSRPRCTPTDHAILVLLASRVTAWRQALLIVQPDTLLRWHRELLRRIWRQQSRTVLPAHRPSLAPETVALTREMAMANRLWGAERIRGELLKLGIRVAKSTVQKYLRTVRPPRRAERAGQTWATFLRNHDRDIWAADFLPVTDVLFRSLHAFFIVEVASRKIVHIGVTRYPTDVRAAQQLREATAYGRHPKYLIRDRDRKYGFAFARVATATGIQEVRTNYRSPTENGVCERYLGSVRRECLDHVLVLGEAHLKRVLNEYIAYFNGERPHQGLEQRVPNPSGGKARRVGPIEARPVLGGLHHAYRRAA